jgi:glycosyltransferase involved in cell wall biosynthesis
MKIVHVITGIAEAAGTSVFACEVANEQARAGHEVCLLVLNRATREYPCDAAVRVVGSEREVGAVDVAHVHGLWTPWLVRQARHFASRGAKIVWSTHGMLTPWALGVRRWKKFFAWRLYQRRALASADLIHVTAPAEVDGVRRLGLENRVAIVPLGVHLGNLIPRAGAADRVRTILFVGRHHRIKGLANLVDAWKLAARPGWRVVLAGPNQDGYADEVLARAAANGVAESVKYLGSVFGAEKDALYASSDVFVLPSFSENFGSVVVEALAQGVPVIATKGTPWGELETERCGWWIDVGVEPLAAALREAMALSDAERVAMGARGRALVAAKYQWPAIGRQMLAAYEKILV